MNPMWWDGDPAWTAFCPKPSSRSSSGLRLDARRGAAVLATDVGRWLRAKPIEQARSGDVGGGSAADGTNVPEYDVGRVAMGCQLRVAEEG